jgi:hypothetical protein
MKKSRWVVFSFRLVEASTIAAITSLMTREPSLFSDWYEGMLQRNLILYLQSPGDYFVRPVLKEYSFEPQTKTVHIVEGQTEIVNLYGNRVAFRFVRPAVSVPVPVPVPMECESVAAASATCATSRDSL